MANEDIEQTLNAQIRFGVDPASTADVKAGLDDIKGELAKTNENVKQIAGNFSNAAQTAKGFIAAGRALKAIGGLIGNEEISKMGKYVTMVGRLTMSYARLIPMMQKLLASQSSLAKLGLTGAAVAGGAFIGAQIYDKMIGPNQQTMNYKTGQMEANTAGNILNQTAAVFSRDMTLVAATLRGDSHAAETANKAFLDTAKMYGIIKTDAEVQIEVQEKLKEKYGSLTLAAIALADKLEHAAKVALASGDVFQEMGGMMKDAASQIIRASASVAAMNDPLVKAYDESQKARAKVDKAYYQDNIKAQAEGLKAAGELQKRYNLEVAKDYKTLMQQETDANRQYSKQRISILMNYADQENAAQAAYFKKRTEAAASFGLEMQRAEADFQRERERATQDHGRNLRKLADERDALGVEDAQEQFRIDQQRSQEDHDTEMARRNEDFGRAMAQLTEQFNAEEAARKADRDKQLGELAAQAAEDKARRLKDFNDMQAEKKAQFGQELKDLNDNQKKKLDDLKNHYDDELTQIDDSWTTRRQELGLWLDGERTQMYNYMAARAADLQKWVDTHLVMPGSPIPVSTTVSPTLSPKRTNVPEYAAGGYTGDGGLSRLHPDEFVLSSDTTRRLEGMAGGRLTQERVKMLTTNKTVTLSPQVNVSVGPVTGDPNQIGEAVRRHVYDVITEVVSAASRQ